MHCEYGVYTKVLCILIFTVTDILTVINIKGGYGMDVMKLLK